jgi:hypothetical protein
VFTRFRGRRWVQKILGENLVLLDMLKGGIYHDESVESAVDSVLVNESFDDSGNCDCC